MVNKSLVLMGSFLGLSVLGASAPASISFTKIGNPVWQPVGGILFSAPIGTGADGYAEFATTMQTILPSPNNSFNPNNGNIIPGASHPGPYDSELINGVAAAGYKTGSTFAPSDFSNGYGVFLGLEYVPTAAAPTGYSPDSANGPIIPNSVFGTNGITYSGETDRNGALFDPNWTGSLSDINDNISYPNPPTTTYAGYSHFPQFWADSYDFGPTDSNGNLIDSADGSYTEAFTLLDASGNGWVLNDSFTVVPEPTSLAMLSAGALLACRRHRAAR